MQSFITYLFDPIMLLHIQKSQIYIQNNILIVWDGLYVTISPYKCCILGFQINICSLSEQLFQVKTFLFLPLSSIKCSCFLFFFFPTSLLFMVIFASHIRVKDWKYISGIIRLNLTLFDSSPLKESNAFIKKKIRNTHHTARPVITDWYSQHLAQTLRFVVWVPSPVEHSSGGEDKGLAKVIQNPIKQRAGKVHIKPTCRMSFYSSVLERDIKFTCTKHCSHIGVWGKESLEWNPYP